MGDLRYFVVGSLDGYIADADGRFDWAEPDDVEVLGFINELGQEVTTYLYGRRMYELMQVWETDPAAAAMSPGSAEFARQWQQARKVVFSTTLPRVSTTRTTLERTFDPGRVRELKAAADGDLYIEGPTLAAHALRAGLVDRFQVILAPVVVGGGKRYYPDGVRLDLRLQEVRRFGNGMAYLDYDVR